MNSRPHVSENTVAHKSVSRASNLKTRATRSGRSAAVCPGRSSLDLKPPPTPRTAGRVSEPRTPARGKQRRVQPRCPRPDRPTLSRFVAPSPLLRASARHRRRGGHGMGHLPQDSQTRYRHSEPVRAQRGMPAPVPHARARTMRHARTCGEVHSHGATQPCIQAKSTRHPRGCVGRSPTIFFIFFYFFPVKIT